MNKDKELVAKIRAALKENDGYCPCRFDKTPDTLCMCKSSARWKRASVEWWVNNGERAKKSI